ncbi:MAG: gluconokinase [Stellaceae bacterium]
MAGIEQRAAKPYAPPVAVVMGVAGAGKTAVGERLGERLDREFAEGDRFHATGNMAKMQSGHPPTDADRAPSLVAIAWAIEAWRAGNARGLITCSGLKREYRRRIIGARPRVRLAYLDGSCQLIAARRGHFMPASLLDSPFAALEPPGPDENPIGVPIDQPLDRIVEQLAAVPSTPVEPGSSKRAFPVAEQR